MDEVLEIHVTIVETFGVQGNCCEVVMIPFSGWASGKYFSGKVIGCGVDTQRKSRDGSVRLSARYMLEGTDYMGEKCRIFIENNTNDLGGLTPSIVTDSKALAIWEHLELSAEITPTESGVDVRIYSAQEP